MNPKAIVALVALAAIAVAAYFLSKPSPGGEGSEAIDFTLYPGAGAPSVSLSDFRGKKVVVFDFWASWCPPCRAAIPSLQKIHEVYADRGVQVIGININDQVDPAEFMAKLNAKYMILRDGEEVARSYGVEGIPTLLVVGKDGKVKLRESGWGPGSEQKLAVAIEDALGQ